MGDWLNDEKLRREELKLTTTQNAESAYPPVFAKMFIGNVSPA